MAEMIGSAVVGETFARISSVLVSKHEERAAARDNIDRLELAHIKMKAALETSDRCRCRIDDECPSLLLWQAKLKRAAEECGEALESYKRRAVEDEEAERRARGSSLAKRFAHTAKSAVFSFLGSRSGGEQQPSGPSVVRRYERYADSACELLRFMEFGAAPRLQQHMLLDPLIERLLEGKFVWCRMLQGSQYRSVRVWPTAFTERGLEALVIFVYQDRAAPENDFSLGLQLRLRERTDVIGLTVKCVQSFRPHLKSVAEAAEKELALMATKSPLHEPCVPFKDLKLCDVHAALAQSSRSGAARHEHVSYEQRMPPCTGHADKSSEQPDAFPEQAVLVFAQWYISPSSYKLQPVSPSAAGDGASFAENQLPSLKLGVSFKPHAAPGGQRAESTAVEIVDGKEERSCRLASVSMHQWDELLLPKAISCLCTKAEAEPTTYEVFWDSAHGAVYLCVEKTSSRNALAPE